VRIRINLSAEETELNRDLLNILKVVINANDLGLKVVTVALDGRVLRSWQNMSGR